MEQDNYLDNIGAIEREYITHCPKCGHFEIVTKRTRPEKCRQLLGEKLCGGIINARA